MIINPIIPIWLMSIICIALMITVILNKPLRKKLSTKEDNEKTDRQKNLIKNYVANLFVKILIIICLFIINLRFMLPDGENTVITSDLNVLFVIDTSISMRALDYNGTDERIQGVSNDCVHIVEELDGCKFSIITFGDTAKKIAPFTTDSNMIISELKSLIIENDYYAQGTSINIVKDLLETTLKEQKKKSDDSKIIVFFVTDGEITKDEETLDSFSSMKQYISNGAVMGYGTEAGGKMINSLNEDNPSSDYYYLYYYDEHYQMSTGISKIDEENLNKIASDIGIDYVYMDNQSSINSKLKEIKNMAEQSQSIQNKTKDYRDIYYYFAIPLVMLLGINFALQKRRIS